MSCHKNYLKIVVAGFDPETSNPKNRDDATRLLTLLGT
jgi:hypothetical protein